MNKEITFKFTEVVREGKSEQHRLWLGLRVEEYLYLIKKQNDKLNEIKIVEEKLKALKQEYFRLCLIKSKDKYGFTLEEL